MTLDNLPLRTKTKPKWIEVVLADFNQFLLDHAACERKAAATALSLVKSYPDRTALLDPMISLAREELLHFKQVCHLLHERQLILGHEYKDLYVKQLRAIIRHGELSYFMDRLLMSGVIEARSSERLAIVADYLTDLKLKKFYCDLAREEAGHYKIFLKVAYLYFKETEIERRLDQILAWECQVLDSIELRAAIH